jgi:branched-chain amino acid transport system substrate-binding protein
MTVKRVIALLSMVLAALLPLAPAQAQAPKEVVIGVMYPLSGPVAQVGIDSVNAAKLAVDIINSGGSALNLPLGKTAGLPGLGGAKIRLVIVDHQGKPDVGQSRSSTASRLRRASPSAASSGSSARHRTTAISRWPCSTS